MRVAKARINRRSGMTLIELVVALGIGSISVLAVGTSLRTAYQAQVAERELSAWVELSQEITQALSSQNYCDANIATIAQNLSDTTWTMPKDSPTKDMAVAGLVYDPSTEGEVTYVGYTTSIENGGHYVFRLRVEYEAEVTWLGVSPPANWGQSGGNARLLKYRRDWVVAIDNTGASAQCII